MPVTYLRNPEGLTFTFGVDPLHARAHTHSWVPDCETLREVAPGKWQRVKAEFEVFSRSFQDHQHDPKGCDMIICWVHNWPECPEWIEVIELSKIVG